MFSQGVYSFSNRIQINKKNYSTETKSARLSYSFNKHNNHLQFNSDLKKHSFFTAKNGNTLSIREKQDLTIELNSIHYFNANKKNEAEIIQTQFAVHKMHSNFAIYPCENISPFDVAYESLIESRPVLSSIAIQAVSQLLNIEEFQSYAGISFSLVLLKYVMESYLPPHKDENYLFSLMTTLQGRNMIGSNCLYATEKNSLPGCLLGEFSDSYYKIVDNRDNGVFHDARIQSISSGNTAQQRDVLIVGIKNHFCRFWSKTDFMRSEETLLPIENSYSTYKLG